MMTSATLSLGTLADLALAAQLALSLFPLVPLHFSSPLAQDTVCLDSRAVQTPRTGEGLL
jgi:hypothetical protein